MSIIERPFYGIVCDFPGCGEQFEGYEYSFMYDPYANADEATEGGWLLRNDGGDFCLAHVVTEKCSPDCLTWSDDDDDPWCKIADDTIGEHRRPMRNDPEEILGAMVARVAQEAAYRLDEVQRRVQRRTELLAMRFTDWANARYAALAPGQPYPTIEVIPIPNGHIAVQRHGITTQP